jgi:hypothetical protein
VTAGKRDLDALIEEITVDCYGEDEELTGFLTYLEDALEQPVEAAVVGVPSPSWVWTAPRGHCVGLWPDAGETAASTRCRCWTWRCRADPSWHGSSQPTGTGRA